MEKKAMGLVSGTTWKTPYATAAAAAARRPVDDQTDPPPDLWSQLQAESATTWRSPARPSSIARGTEPGRAYLAVTLEFPPARSALPNAQKQRLGTPSMLSSATLHDVRLVELFLDSAHCHDVGNHNHGSAVYEHT